MLFGNKLKFNKGVVLLIILIVSMLILTIPFFRESIVKFAELLLHRDIDNAWWSLKLRDALLGIVSLLLILYLDYGLLKKHFDKKSLIISVNILAFFAISNYFIRINGDYFGYGIVWDNGDFVECIRSGYGTGSLYGTNYPPLAVMMFRWLHQYALNSDGTVNEYACLYLTNLFILIVVISYILILKKYIDGTVENSNTVVVSIFFTSSFLFCLQRMNIMYLAAIFTMIFIIYYSSDVKWKRLLALLSLAIAANIKYFPAIFGMLLIKKRMWKEAVICALLGVLIFLTPMLLPVENDVVLTSTMSESRETVMDTSDTKTELEGLIDAVSEFANPERTVGRTLSMQSVVYNILLPFEISTGVVLKIGLVVQVLNSVLMFICFWKTDRKDYELTILSLFSYFWIPTSNWYFTLFLIPAYLEFLKLKDKSKQNILMALLWVCLLTYRWGFANDFYLQDWKSTFIMWLIVMTAVLIEIIQTRKMGNENCKVFG